MKNIHFFGATLLILFLCSFSFHAAALLWGPSFQSQKTEKVTVSLNHVPLTLQRETYTEAGAWEAVHRKTQRWKEDGWVPLPSPRPSEFFEVSGDPIAVALLDHLFDFQIFRKQEKVRVLFSTYADDRLLVHFTEIPLRAVDPFFSSGSSAAVFQTPFLTVKQHVEKGEFSSLYREAVQRLKDEGASPAGVEADDAQAWIRLNPLSVMTLQKHPNGLVWSEWKWKE